MAEERIRPEIIPLSYEPDGRVFDLAGNVRNVEAIPYGIDQIFISVNMTGALYESCAAVLDFFERKLEGEWGEALKKDLEGKVGFITGPNVRVDDSQEEAGYWISVQLYRVKD